MDNSNLELRMKEPKGPKDFSSGTSCVEGNSSSGFPKIWSEAFMHSSCLRCFFVDNDYENKTVNKNTTKSNKKTMCSSSTSQLLFIKKHSSKIRESHWWSLPFTCTRHNIQGTLWDAWKMVLKLGATFLLGPNDWRSQIAWGKTVKKSGPFILDVWFGILWTL